MHRFARSVRLALTLGALALGGQTAFSQTRPLKSMTSAQVEGFLQGRGMSLALPAELNHWPGPRHTLELADSLRLSVDQREQVAKIEEAMLAEVRPLGHELIRIETALEEAFAARQASPMLVQQLTDTSAHVMSALRFAHLRAHLTMQDVLSPHQRQEYDRLRGYTASPGGGEGHRHP